MKDFFIPKNDHRRMVLLRNICNRTKKEEREYNSLSRTYSLTENQELGLKNELSNLGLIDAVPINIKDDGYGGVTMDGMEYSTNESGRKAIRHFTIPSEANEKKVNRNQKWFTISIASLGILISAFSLVHTLKSSHYIEHEIQSLHQRVDVQHLQIDSVQKNILKIREQSIVNSKRN